MQNTRALYLIDKSNLEEKEKDFLKTHLEVYQDRTHSLEAEILRLKDIIDYSKSLDDMLMALKENVVEILQTAKNPEEVIKKLDFIYNHINK